MGASGSAEWIGCFSAERLPATRGRGAGRPNSVLAARRVTIETIEDAARRQGVNILPHAPADVRFGGAAEEIDVDAAEQGDTAPVPCVQVQDARLDGILEGMLAVIAESDQIVHDGGQIAA